jgi:hypothetical protein
MSQPSMSVTEDRTEEILKMIKSFKKDSVLVGIPESDSERKDGDPISNAALLFINNFGSPGQNIPARPVMEIGLKNAQDRIAEEFKKALQQSWKNGLSALPVYYNRIGMIASNSVKRAINDQIDIQEPANSTIKTRESQGFMGKKALLVTGQMRNAITWVVQEGGI